jgi:hypothetical protein
MGKPNLLRLSIEDYDLPRHDDVELTARSVAVQPVKGRPLWPLSSQGSIWPQRSEEILLIAQTCT